MVAAAAAARRARHLPPSARAICARALRCWASPASRSEKSRRGRRLAPSPPPPSLLGAHAQKALRRAYELYHRPFLSKADVLGEQFATLARHTNRTYCSVAKQAAKQAGAHELTSRCAAADTREAALNAFAEATRREGALFDRQLASPSACLLYTSPSPRDQRGSRMPSSA